jgi:hypothetical protein
LKRVVARALAPRLENRYPSAADFQADLLALAENRPTIADLQPAPHDPDATRRTAGTALAAVSEAARAGAQAPPVDTPDPSSGSRNPVVTSTPAKRRLFRRPLRLAILAVLLVVALREISVMGAAAEFRASLPLKDRADMDAAWSEFQSLGERSPLGIAVAGVREPFKDHLVDFAERIVHGYRSEVTTIRERDWQDARRYLSRALSVGGRDRFVRARFRYTEGHLHRINGDARQRRPQEAREFYNEAIVAFEDAARLDGDWPDPHLGLARVYFNGLEDVERGAAALAAAEQKGFKSGQRELALRADAYRRHGERLWREAVAVRGLPQEDQVLERAAEADREAMKLYGALMGFGDAASQLTRTHRHVRMIETRLAELREPFDWPW